MNVIAWDMEGSRQVLSSPVWAHEGRKASRGGESRRWCLEATGHFWGWLWGGEARWDLSVSTGRDQVRGVPGQGKAWPRGGDVRRVNRAALVGGIGTRFEDRSLCLVLLLSKAGPGVQSRAST